MMRKLFFVLLMLLVSAAGNSSAAIDHAKEHAAGRPPLQIYKDTSVIQLKHFDQAALDQFRKEAEFDYRDREGAGEPSFFEKFRDWLTHKLFGWMKYARLDGTWAGFFLTLLEYVFFAALFGLLLFVITKAMGIDLTGIFRRTAKRVDVPFTEWPEDIHVINFDDELERALSKNNYRLAVRLLYLGSLRQLSDRQLIHWQIDKTNAAYVNELEDPSRKQAFGLITRQFEYVWYGNFNIDQDAFAHIRRLFHDFKQHLP